MCHLGSRFGLFCRLIEPRLYICKYTIGIMAAVQTCQCSRLVICKDSSFEAYGVKVLAALTCLKVQPHFALATYNTYVAVTSNTNMTRFRPCIDLHAGSVKQIVGGTLSTNNNDTDLKTNFTSEHPSAYFAELYEKNSLRGGHVIMLGPGNEIAAWSAPAVRSRGPGDGSEPPSQSCAPPPSGGAAARIRSGRRAWQ